MELLGQIGERQIFYCNIRSDKNWFDGISFDNWIAFTIVNKNDKEYLQDLILHCLNKGVCYSCSAGELASLTEDYFDEEIVERQVQQETKTEKTQDYEQAPMTSFHKNFDEGFWFAATTAVQIVNDAYVISKQVVCVDATQDSMREQLINLIDKINNGWLPSD